MQIILTKNIIELGHLFEGRFKSKNVEGQEYILNLIRYIHQNPQKAGISKIIQYNWSSYLEYLDKSKEESELVDKKEIFNMFSENEEIAIKKFIKFNLQILKIKKSRELTEYEMRDSITDEELIYFIENELNIKNIQEIQQYNAKYRNDLIKEIKKIYGTTHKQLSRVLGINIRIIQRAK